MTRPEPFLGNSAVIERLESKLVSGRLPHGLIFSGPEGVGKRTYALRLIQALNCREDVTRGCGICGSCQRIVRGTHPDVRMISVEGDATQIRIEQIRELREALLLAPASGVARAVIIDPAERLTLGAANALLKTLEEPPPSTFFFLITPNANELLITIRSRCQVYHFTPLSLEAIRDLGIEDELVARWSQGSVGRALQADPSEIVETRNRVLGFLETALNGEAAQLAELIGARLASSREEFRELARAGCLLVSDLMRLKVGVGGEIINIDVRDRLEALSAVVGIAALVEAGRQLRFVESSQRHFVNAQLTTDAMLTSLGPRPNSR